MDEKKRFEYSELTVARRHYSTTRFANITVFMAVTAGLLSATKNTEVSSIYLYLFGFLVGLILWYVEYTFSTAINVLNERLKAVESEIGIAVYTDLQKRYIPGIYTFGVLFLSSIFYWGYCFIRELFNV